MLNGRHASQERFCCVKWTRQRLSHQCFQAAIAAASDSLGCERLVNRCQKTPGFSLLISSPQEGDITANYGRITRRDIDVGLSPTRYAISPPFGGYDNSIRGPILGLTPPGYTISPRPRLRERRLHSQRNRKEHAISSGPSFL
jgi:hypothetical protein